MLDFEESMLPTGLEKEIKKLVSNPVKAGITIFLVYKILKPFLKKESENYVDRLKEINDDTSDWTSTKILSWKKKYKKLEVSEALSGKLDWEKKVNTNVEIKWSSWLLGKTLWIKPELLKNNNKMFLFFVNNKILSRHNNIKDAKKALIKEMERLDKEFVKKNPNFGKKLK